VALGVCAIVALIDAVLFQAPELLGKEKVLTDFDAFHIAGSMALEGRATDAYRAAALFAAQEDLTGTRSFMPWTYPPPYTLAMMALATLPIGIAYLLFLTATFGFFLLIIRHLAGIYTTAVVIAIVPTIFILVRSGQNGFLTAGLIGWFCSAFANRQISSGIPLGLMIIKPHLAAGIAVLALLGRGWSIMALAAAVVAAALATATMAFGPNIWAAFFGGVQEASEFLAAAYYPLHRMTSLYAFLRSFGLEPELATALHAVGALLAIIAFVLVWRKSQCPRITAAAACCMSLFISPYSYDYDLTIMGVAIALVIPAIMTKARSWELKFMLFLTWVATGYGLGAHTIWELNSTSLVHGPGGGDLKSLAVIPLLVLILTAWRVLRRVHPATPPVELRIA
jgi:hypothetical protein